MAVCFAGDARVTTGADHLRTKANEATSLIAQVTGLIDLTSAGAAGLAQNIKATAWPPVGKRKGGPVAPGTTNTGHVVSRRLPPLSPPLPMQPTQDDIDDLVEKLNATTVQLGSVRGDINEFDPGFLNDDVEKYNKMRSAATLAFSAFITIIAIAAIPTTCSKRRGFMKL